MIEGEQVLNNLRSLFPLRGHELIETPWLDHCNFVELVKLIDLGMQVSMSETFNIVAADFVTNNVPIVVSPEIDWMSCVYKCDPNSTDSIVRALKRAWTLSRFNIQTINQYHLRSSNRDAVKAWLREL